MDAAQRSDPPVGITLGFVGDLALGRDVSDRVVGGLTADGMWNDVGPAMRATDGVIGNLECAVSRRGTPWPRLKAYRFRADPLVLERLREGNVRCVALANNHVLDYSAEGLADTRLHLRETGIAFAGAGANLAEAIAPTVFAAGRYTIGFASLTNTVPEFGATPEGPGTAYLKIRNDAASYALVSGLVGELRRRGAEILVLGIHWGPNFRWWPPSHYRAFAKQALAAGFDIVHGHSAHILQAAEFHGNGLILYDTGDFIDDFRVIPPFRSDRSFLFVADVAPGRVSRLSMLPVSLKIGEVHVAKGAEAEAIREGMVQRCRGYAIALRREDEALVGRPPPDRAP